MSEEQVLAFNASVIEEFRTNEGKLGGHFADNPTLLMTMIGAKTGRSLTSPLSYASDGDAFIIMASAGGSPTAPAWTFNLRANPDVILEVGAERFEARAVETEGAARARAFAVMTEQLPRFADYQSSVERQIPVFRLERI